jgi:hypothetical protein
MLRKVPAGTLAVPYSGSLRPDCSAILRCLLRLFQLCLHVLSQSWPTVQSLEAEGFGFLGRWLFEGTMAGDHGVLLRDMALQTPQICENVRYAPENATGVQIPEQEGQRFCQ